MRVHASAPIRICDIGGWTDTWFARRGKVFNIAVRPVVAVEIERFPRGTRSARVIIEAESYGVRYAPDLEASTWGPHPLLEAALQAIPPPADRDVEVTIRATAPPGASTGTSAAVVVALLGALDRLSGGHRTPLDIAREAHAVETIRLQRQCGVQDQLCSASGGVNFIDIVEYPHADLTRLDLNQDFLQELNRRLAVVYLGRSHDSSEVHERVVRELTRVGPDCAPLNALRTAAVSARDAALAGDFAAFGRAMSANTEAQSELHPDLVGAAARRVIELAAAHRALGWKVNGAGGEGGSLTILHGGDPDARSSFIRALEQESTGYRSIAVEISMDGLRIW